MSVRNSATLAAVTLLAANSGITEENVVSELCEFVGKGSFCITLNAPAQLTCKSGGKYSKVPYIGGEKFTVVGAYLGKRDGIIIQAKGGMGKGTSVIEIPASTAESQFDGYEAMLTSFVGAYGMEDDAADMTIARSEADLLEQEAHQKALLETRMEDGRFGSW